MFEKIFEEIFGERLFDNFEEVSKKFKEEENAKEDVKDSSYFHSITEEYENGKCVSHSEKEIKDGKVIKDVTETHKLEDKSEDAVKTDETKDSNVIEYYKKKNEELCKKVDEKNNIIDELTTRCEQLEKENNRIKGTLKDLIQPKYK